MTQEQTDAAVAALLNGKSAEIFANLDPDTGRCQINMKLEHPFAAALLLSQIVERIARNGIEDNVIRNSVELGLTREYWT